MRYAMKNRMKKLIPVMLAAIVFAGNLAGTTQVQASEIESRTLDIYDDLKEKIESGMPVWGTCAGMILLAKSICNDDTVHLGTMDIEVKRNAYGRQLGSFNTKSNVKGIGEDIEMVFIRAPYIENVDDNVEVLSVVDNNIVAAKENNMLVTSFHPELTSDYRVHKYFLKMVEENNKGS